MPELADVEGFRRMFARHGQGQHVRRVEVRDRGVLRNVTPQALGRALHNRRFDEPRRHGKWLLTPADGPAVVWHFGMTGDLSWAPDSEGRHPLDRLLLVLDDGELRYRDQRKLRGVWLLRTGEELDTVTGALGPDAMRVSYDDFADRLRGTRRRVKAALLDQRVLAGLGNLLSDEILWRARVPPQGRTDELPERELKRMYDAMRGVLRYSARVGRVPGRDNWLTGHRDPRCPRCGTALSRGTVAGRTTIWCSNCQAPAS